MRIEEKCYKFCWSRSLINSEKKIKDGNGNQRLLKDNKRD